MENAFMYIAVFINSINLHCLRGELSVGTYVNVTLYDTKYHKSFACCYHMQKRKMVVWGGLTNSCDMKRSKKQRKKGKIFPFECKVPKNSQER